MPVIWCFRVVFELWQGIVRKSEKECQKGCFTGAKRVYFGSSKELLNSNDPDEKRLKQRVV
jgi:hypothetical protein